MSISPPRHWGTDVSRVLIHVPRYLSSTGEETAGGRQRTVRDVSQLIRTRWGREATIVQKATKPFELADKLGTPVIGVKVPLRAHGDPLFGLATRRLIREGDGVLTLGQEDAWPFFIQDAKAMHTGVWWDYPIPPLRAYINQRRVLGLVRASRSVWCVDTNVINWVRGRGSEGHNLVKKMQYEPNCVDLDLLGQITRRDCPHQPPHILFARRYEHKRGGTLLLEALRILKRHGFSFRATFSLASGAESLQTAARDIKERGLTTDIELKTNTLDSVLAEYASADVAVIPTLWSEGTSYSCIEAIAAGVPPIVTPVGGLGNLVIPNFNGLIAQPTPESLAAAIRSATADERWGVMRKNCLSLRSTFSKTAWDERFLAWVQD